MTVIHVKFINMVKIRVQAQIFNGRTLVSSCVAGPGETRSLAVESERYDIFFKNGSTGWEIARKLNSDAVSFTLTVQNGHYILK